MAQPHPTPLFTRPKRSDLPTRKLLEAVAYWQTLAWERLVDVYPPKLVLAAMQRDVDRGLLDYGVALRRPFLTATGRAFLADKEV